jgi:uncharacterized OB-fold protein
VTEDASERPFLPTRAPHRTLETAEFWDACAAGRLALPRCDDCGELIWYPRLVCPFCGSHAVTYADVSGRGTVYSFSVMRRGQGPFREVAPYVLAMVQLEEGPVMMTNVVDVDPDDVVVGQAVHVVFEPAEGGDAVPRFAPGG